MSKANIYMKDKEAAKDVTDEDSIKAPPAGYILVVTSAEKLYKSSHRDVFETTKVKLTDKAGKANPVVDRYIRKWRAKEKRYCDNNIVKILFPPGFKEPAFSDELLRKGFVPEKSSETTAIESLMVSIEKLVNAK